MAEEGYITPAETELGRYYTFHTLNENNISGKIFGILTAKHPIDGWFQFSNAVVNMDPVASDKHHIPLHLRNPFYSKLKVYARDMRNIQPLPTGVETLILLLLKSKPEIANYSDIISDIVATVEPYSLAPKPNDVGMSLATVRKSGGKKSRRKKSRRKK